MSQLNTTKYLGQQRVTGLSSVQTLTPPVGATLALITAEAQAVRWTAGSDANPTASVGNPLAAGASLKWDSFNPATQTLYPIRFIEQAASAVLNVTYYE